MHDRIRSILRDLAGAVVYGGLMFALVYASFWIALQNPVLDATPVAQIAANTEGN